uniref:Putative extracellular protein TR9_019 n=1 Tax=Trebouxia lynnae TaxID=1825957 RepID=A0A7L9QEE2_9CHLO|nr:putative extracellular protein TR9_019 [Trebouxia lynnae]
MKWSPQIRLQYMLRICLAMIAAAPRVNSASLEDSRCMYSHESLLLALPASTGCISALGQCTTTLTITLPSNCTGDLQGPHPTVLMFAGYQVPIRYYQSLAEALAKNGFTVMQYERAAVLPAAEVESAYFEPLMQWRSAVNSSADSAFYSKFAEGLALAGHSMGGGLAAVAAGSHSGDVATAFLMDPVDWNFGSNRVDSQYLTRFAKPVAIAPVGVHCLDRNGCYAPTNCSKPISNSPDSEGCSPSWWCCDWDSGLASASGRITQGARANPNGAQSFWASAPEGSWQVNLPFAGHMSFLDYDPGTNPVQLLNCPYTHSHTDIQPAVENLLVAWMSHHMFGKPLGSGWTAVEGGFLEMKHTSTAY